MRWYPRDYESYEPPVSCGEVKVWEKNAVFGTIRQKPSVRRFGNNSITMARLSDPTGELQLNWFHMPYLRNTLPVGRGCVFRGMVIEKNGRRILQHPQVYEPQAYDKLTHRLLPVYPLTEGLSGNTVRRILQQILEECPSIPEILPRQIRDKEELPDIQQALQSIHFPQDRRELERAKKRLVFEEFLLFQLGVAGLRLRLHQELNTCPMPKTERTESIAKRLPFHLTDSQQQVLQEIGEDLGGPYSMRRLIQGDVGSGKTILAFLSMLRAFENGYQSALMAPTDVLATQHYGTLCRFLKEYDLLETVRPVLRKGSLTQKEKREIDRQIASGEARMILGTHALIQEDLSYPELGLVITDEQHRFGVRQRKQLSEKGTAPHVLVMSATPIPRTLAMILYGDLDLSVLRDMPAHRLPVKNCVVNEQYREAAWRFMEKETALGHQVYVVCPMIDPDEELPCENVLDYGARLQERFRGRISVGILHGKMKPEEKQQIMQDFAKGKLRILVSTTVIEVGIDVPNATVMMIENAERFGLAQLHQLRGRVGRGTAQSYCIFVQGNDRPETRDRLEILNHSNDGFYIAEQDLKLRGPGDLFGIRQSGLALFSLGDIYRDADVLERADACAKEIIKEDPELENEEHLLLKQAVTALFYSQNDSISPDSGEVI